jgi:hypothetical protein
MQRMCIGVIKASGIDEFLQERSHNRVFTPFLKSAFEAEIILLILYS